MTPEMPGARAKLDDPLSLPTAGLRAVRGGAVRVAGYLAGSGLATAASIILLRYLGVVDFGRYVTVMSIVAIVTGLTDVGLTLIGQREYVLEPTEESKRRLTATVLGIRLVVTPIGVALAVLFTVVAGYRTQLVLAAAIAGASVVFGNIALTYTIPLSAQLRFGAVTVVEVAQQLLTVVGNALLVVVGAHLLAFFGVPVIAAIGAAVAAAVLLGLRHLARPRFVSSEWRSVLAEALPMGVAVIVSVLYLRTLVVMASLLTSGYETGLFATSYRVLQVLAGIPALMVGSAFPLMTSAAPSDSARLRYIVQRVLEASLLIGILLIIVLAIAAEPIVRILGGAAYTPSATVLRIQAFALLGSFASVIWTTALIAMRRQSALIVINGLAFACVVALGGVLIPWLGAKGAAISAVGGEALLAAVALTMLVRAGSGFLPDPRFLARLAPGALLAGGCGFVPGVPALGRAGLGVLVFSAAALALRAVPPEMTDAVTSWRRPAT